MHKGKQPHWEHGEHRVTQLLVIHLHIIKNGPADWKMDLCVIWQFWGLSECRWWAHKIFFCHFRGALIKCTLFYYYSTWNLMIFWAVKADVNIFHSITGIQEILQTSLFSRGLVSMFKVYNWATIICWVFGVVETFLFHLYWTIKMYVDCLSGGLTYFYAVTRLQLHY